MGGLWLEYASFNTEKATPLFHSLAMVFGGWRPFGVICGMLFLVLSILFFLKNHDCEADPLEKACSFKIV
jgi:hypothetical protein